MDIELTPISPLMVEHRLIERMVQVVSNALNNINEINLMNIEFINQSIDFAKTYTHRCHHGKEEEILFKILAFKKMLPEHKKLMDDLVLEHIHGMKIIYGLEEAKEAYLKGQKNFLKDVIANFKKWVEFYLNHIQKEEKTFFQPAMEYFSKHEQEEMLKKFWEFDQYLIHEKYIKMVELFEGEKERGTVGKPYL